MDNTIWIHIEYFLHNTKVNSGDFTSEDVSFNISKDDDTNTLTINALSAFYDTKYCFVEINMPIIDD